MLGTINEITWSELASGTGRATRIPQRLRQLSAANEIAAVEVIHHLLDDIWVDGEVFPATAATVPFLCEFLDPPVNWIHPKIMLVLGVLAEGRSADAQTAHAVRSAIESRVDTYLAVARSSDGSAAVELTLLYLLAHFPQKRSHIRMALDLHRWGNDDVARLERCLTVPDFSDPATFTLISRAWPTPAIWQMKPGEDALDRAWKESLGLDAAEAARIWDLETESLLTYLGAHAEYVVEVSGVR